MRWRSMHTSPSCTDATKEHQQWYLLLMLFSNSSAWNNPSLHIDQVSEKIQWTDQKLWRKNGHFDHFGSILGSLGPLIRTRNLTESRQMVHFQVLEHLHLGPAPWKTTRKTYILTFLQFWKTPQNGVFWALKSPEGHEPVLPGSAICILHRVPLPPCFD